MYTISDAARYVGAHRSTLSSWFRARSKRGPLLRRKTESGPISYVELIEAAVVVSFLKEGVSIRAVRRAREYLAEMLGVRYPFAQVQLKTDGARILLEWREDPAREIRDRMIWTDRGGQFIWAEGLEARLAQFTYDDALVISWRPLGKDSPIEIDPRYCFGAPHINGVATWAIKERHDAGEPIDFIADDYGLPVAYVGEALRFEGVPV